MVAARCCGQDSSGSEQVLSTGERLIRAEEILNGLRSKRGPTDIDLVRRAEKELKSILEADPQTVFRSQVEADLDIVNESLAYHDLLVAAFYMSRPHSLRDARSRLANITELFPKFSKMDEVLLRMSLIAVAEDHPDEASRTFWKLICTYPNSEYVPEAFKQLNQIGVSSWEGCQQYKP